jgi:hypothetical protein
LLHTIRFHDAGIIALALKTFTNCHLFESKILVVATSCEVIIEDNNASSLSNGRHICHNERGRGTGRNKG